jgi:hypothetical protein
MADGAGEGQLPSLFSPVQQTIVKEFGQHINATRLKAAAVAVTTDEFVFNRESFSAPNLHLDSVVNVVKSVSVNLNFGAPTSNPTAPPAVTKEHYYPEFLPSSLFMSGKDKVKLFDTAAKENRSSRAPPEAPVPVYVHRRMMRPFAPTELQAYKDMATATKQHDTNTSILMHETGKRELNGNAMHQRSVQLAMDRKTMRHKFRTLNELDEEIGTSAAHFVEHGKFAERKVKRVRKAARSQSQLNTRPKSFYCALHDYLRDHKLRLVDLFHKIDGKRECSHRTCYLLTLPNGPVDKQNSLDRDEFDLLLETIGVDNESSRYEAFAAEFERLWCVDDQVIYFSSLAAKVKEAKAERMREKIAMFSHSRANQDSQTETDGFCGLLQEFLSFRHCRLVDVFNSFDKSKDGTLDADEFASLTASLGMDLGATAQSDTFHLLAKKTTSRRESGGTVVGSVNLQDLQAKMTAHKAAQKVAKAKKQVNISETGAGRKSSVLEGISKNVRVLRKLREQGVQEERAIEAQKWDVKAYYKETLDEFMRQCKESSVSLHQEM